MQKQDFKTLRGLLVNFILAETRLKINVGVRVIEAAFLKRLWTVESGTDHYWSKLMTYDVDDDDIDINFEMLGPIYCNIAIVCFPFIHLFS